MPRSACRRASRLLYSATTPDLLPCGCCCPPGRRSAWECHLAGGNSPGGKLVAQAHRLLISAGGLTDDIRRIGRRPPVVTRRRHHITERQVATATEPHAGRSVRVGDQAAVSRSWATWRAWGQAAGETVAVLLEKGFDQVVNASIATSTGRLAVVPTWDADIDAYARYNTPDGTKIAQPSPTRRPNSEAHCSIAAGSPADSSMHCW